MAYQTRCPECQAKLRLDDTPAADEEVECPKCGTQFTPMASSVAAKPSPKSEKAPKSEKSDKPKLGDKSKKSSKKGDAKAEGDGKKKKYKAKKKKSNVAVMAMMVAGAFVILACIGTIAYLLLSKSGKIEDLLTYVPGDFNHTRGVNVGLINRYPGYKPEMEKQLAVAIKEVADEIAKAADVEPGLFLDYAISSKKREGGTAGQIFVLKSARKFDATALLAKLGGAAQNIDGQAYTKLAGKAGLLTNACVYAPTDRLVIVVTAAGNQDAVLRASIGGRKQKETTLGAKLGATGGRVTKGNIWLLVQATGDLSGYIKSLGEGVKDSHSQVTSQTEQSKMFGMFVNFGGRGVVMGAALQCANKEAAKSLYTQVSEGPLSKGDDSEPPNDFKKVFSSYATKEFKIYLADLTFNTTGDCAYFQSRLIKDKAQQMLGTFNNPNAADSAPVGVGGINPFGR